VVTRDAVETAVHTLMDEGETAEGLRIRPKDYAIKARRAFDEEGSSYNNIRLLIQDMGNKTDTSGC
jgi:UDP-glucosyl transferase 73C